jgi:hypothetical protein
MSTNAHHAGPVPSRRNARSPRRRLFSRAGARVLGLALALGGCGAVPGLLNEAHAQASETSDGRMHATYIGGRFHLTDTITHRPLIQTPSTQLWRAGDIVPDIQVLPKPGGADIVYTFRNTTQVPKRLGVLCLPGIRFPGTVEHYRFRQDTYTDTLSNFALAEAIYPNGTYSPIVSIQDDRHVLTASLLYPAVDYDHQVQYTLSGLARFPGDGGQHWGVEFNFQHTRFNVMLPPATTRTYTVAVRAVPRDQNWLKTVVPYRDYFRSLYGPVDYVRDSRPVVGEAVSAAGVSTDQNPRGFLQGSRMRPDLNGWGPWANKLRTYPNFGYNRVMVWAPSGCFRYSQLNFPYQFMTGMNSIPLMRSTLPELASVAGPNMALGFWWGRCLHPMRGWDVGMEDWNLDVNNPQHIAMAFAEVDMAVAAGATMIGLDAFSPGTPGVGYNYLKRLKQRAPNVKFISENAASDLYHNLAPTFHEAHGCLRPHVLADFLNPGHEIWASITRMLRPTTGTPTVAERQAEMRRVAELGFVPLIYGPTPVPSGLLAVESWRTTIPPELRTAPPMPEAPQAASATGGGTQQQSMSRQHSRPRQRVVVVPSNQ